jgi:TusA-related sulfurtransferase
MVGEGIGPAAFAVYRRHCYRLTAAMATRPRHPSEPDTFLDLTGMACPMNWAQAKATLETMSDGQVLELITDDPRAASDIPRAVEAEGWWVLLVEKNEVSVRIKIER